MCIHEKRRVAHPVLHVGEVSEFIVNEFFDGRISTKKNCPLEEKSPQKEPLDFSIAVFKGSGGKFDTLKKRGILVVITTKRPEGQSHLCSNHGTHVPNLLVR